jgi:hypothetical protein
MSVSRASVFAVLVVAVGCCKSERWSEEEWSRTLGRAEERIPSPPPDMKLPSCSSDPTAGKCFLDAEERSIRHALLLNANLVHWGWTTQLCKQIASHTRRAEWPKLAEACAENLRHFRDVDDFRGSGLLDDAALVAAFDREGRAEYVHFLDVLSSRLGHPLEDSWHKELRVVASRRDASAPRLTFPLPPSGCAGEDSGPDCFLLPEQRVRHRIEILQTFLNTWMAQLWTACEGRAATATKADLPALATICLDVQDLLVTSALSGIRQKDGGLIGCKSLALEVRDWPAFIDDKLAGLPVQEVAVKAGPCEDPSSSRHQ